MKKKSRCLTFDVGVQSIAVIVVMVRPKVYSSYILPVLPR